VVFLWQDLKFGGTQRQTLEAAMGRLLENPAGRQGFGLMARQRVWQEFSLDAMLRQPAEVFQDLLLHAHHRDSS
jgi:hypothetical protein